MNHNNHQALTLASEATKLLPVCLVLFLAPSLLTQARYLLALGLTGAEIQADHQLGCGMTMGLLQKEVVGRLQKPTEELQIMFPRPLLASYQPEFDSLVKAVTPQCCVCSWMPITSRKRGKVWEGVTFELT